jgi:hypothetical protein
MNKLNNLLEFDSYVRAQLLLGYPRWDGVPAIPGFTTEPVTACIPMKCRNGPQDDLVLRHDMIVNATDGYVGKVDKLLIDLNDMQVTHVVLVVRHIFDANEIVIPISQIDHINEGTIYLKLDRQEVKKLTTMPRQRWSL